VEDVLLELVECLDNPALSLLQWNEEFSYIEGRLPPGLAPRLNAVTAEHEAALNSAFTGDRANTEFPGRMLIRIMRETVEVSSSAGWFVHVYMLCARVLFFDI
jgi:acetyl-CoA carboxylase/biotin carboxylase 1